MTTALNAGFKVAIIGGGPTGIGIARELADGGIDFTEANLDLAIFWTDGAGEHEGVQLADALMVTVAGPGSNSDTRIAWPGCPASDSEPALRLGDDLARDDEDVPIGERIARVLGSQPIHGRPDQPGEIVSGLHFRNARNCPGRKARQAHDTTSRARSRGRISSA